MMEKKGRFSLWLALLLVAALLTALPAAQADDGLAWMDELCPADEDGVHSISWDDVPGDCTHDSISTVYCSRCGKSHTERDPAPGHQWDEGKVTKEATCTEAGERTYTCTRLIVNMWCGATRTESIPALGHAWDSGIVTKAATATEEGVKTYTCTRCGTTRTEAVPKLDPVVPPPAAHEHSWSGWMKDEKVHASCVTKDRQYRICSSCGETEYRYGSYGGHDWGEWHVAKAPTATEPGTEERVCRLDNGHREEREIPATGEPEATGTLIVTKIAGDTKQPLAGAHFRLDGPDVVDEWISTTEPHTVEGLAVNEIYTLFEVSAPDGYKTADSITFRVAGTDPLPLTVVDEKDGLHPSLSLSASWAPDAGAGKAYVGAEVEYTLTLTNTGDCPVRWSYTYDTIVSAAGPGGSVGRGELVRLNPGESVTWTIRNKIQQYHVDGLQLSSVCCATGNYTDVGGEEKKVQSNITTVDIPLTYPDGAAPEPARPALMLNWNYDSPAKNVYQPEDKAWAYNTVTNTGNVPLKVVIHRKADGVSEYDVDSGVFDPGESVSGIQIGCSSGGLQAWVAPGSGTEELLGVVRLSYYAVGYDPETGEELCRSEPIYRDWKVARPGPVPWPIPSMTNMTAEIRVSPGYESSDPAGYQLGEEWGIHLNTQSTGKEAIPAYAIHVYDPYDGFTDSWYNHDFMPGETIIGTNGGWDLSAITEEDVARGYIYLPPVEFTWTDPESGETMAVKSNELTLMVINRPGLLLEKKLKSVPGSPGYFREGDTLEWELTVANTSKEPVKNVTVADRGETVGTYAEIGPGEQYSVVFSTGPVTDYDVAVGEVKNYFTATSVDLTGGQRTWVSNFATAPTNESSLPVPDPGASRGSGDPRSDPGDPMGTVYGLKVGAQIIKEEAGSPLNGEYYELNETVNFVIRVRNTGEVPLENVSVVDSLGGLAPVGTAAGVAPGEEATFNFSYVVQQSDIDSGWVINSAIAAYQFDGGKPGTPVKSENVRVKAGDRSGDDGFSGGGRFTPVTAGQDGTLVGDGPQNCELRLDALGESEADYTLHACVEHTAAAAAAEAAGLAGDWATAARIWREEVEKMYEAFYEAADAEAKSVLVQERAAFLAYADAWQNLAGNEAAAYLMRVRCARMCCMIHTLPAGLPGSIVDSRNMLSGGEASEKTIREIGALRGSDSAVTELYAGAEARALNDVRNLLDETGKAYYGEAFVRGQRIWQVALDASVNGMYKAADKDARKLIIAWRTALDTLYAAEKPLMEMLYPDSNATVQEELMNLYKDAALDVSMMK